MLLARDFVVASSFCGHKFRILTGWIVLGYYVSRHAPSTPSHPTYTHKVGKMEEQEKIDFIDLEKNINLYLPN